MFILDHTQEIWPHFDFLNIEGFLYSKRKQSGVVLIKPITLLDPKQRQNIVNIWYLLYCHTVLTYFTSMWLDFRICECKWKESYVLLGKRNVFLKHVSWNCCDKIIKDSPKHLQYENEDICWEKQNTSEAVE